MPTISGTTRNAAGVLCAKMVRAYRRRDGKFAGEVVSNATTGEYSITALDASPHVVYEIDGVVTPGDPYWENVSLAMHMNGANNSTTFTDEKGHVLTPTGVVNISTAQSIFGGSSAYFSGGTSSLTGSSPDFAMGTGNLTCEFWLYVPTLLSTAAAIICLGASGNGVVIYLSATNTLTVSTPGQYLFGASAFLASTWYHVELSRVSGLFKLFVDGTQTDSKTDASSFALTSVAVGAGGGRSSITAYIDDLRIERGRGKHTAAFTRPTTPFMDAQAISAPTEKPQVFDNVIPI